MLRRLRIVRSYSFSILLRSGKVGTAFGSGESPSTMLTARYSIRAMNTKLEEDKGKYETKMMIDFCTQTHPFTHIVQTDIKASTAFR